MVNPERISRHDLPSTPAVLRLRPCSKDLKGELPWLPWSAEPGEPGTKVGPWDEGKSSGKIRGNIDGSSHERTWDFFLKIAQLQAIVEKKNTWLVDDRDERSLISWGTRRIPKNPKTGTPELNQAVLEWNDRGILWPLLR